MFCISAKAASAPTPASENCLAKSLTLSMFSPIEPPSSLCTICANPAAVSLVTPNFRFKNPSLFIFSVVTAPRVLNVSNKLPPNFCISTSAALNNGLTFAISNASLPAFLKLTPNSSLTPLTCFPALTINATIETNKVAIKDIGFAISAIINFFAPATIPFKAVLLIFNPPRIVSQFSADTSCIACCSTIDSFISLRLSNLFLATV